MPTRTSRHALRDIPATTSFVANPDGTVTYNAQTTMTTMFVPYIAPSVNINRSATAKATVSSTPGTPGSSAVTETSCILSTGENLTVDASTLTFNGSPQVNLSGCYLRSNKSKKCNGGSTMAAAAYAVGSIVGCSNPNPNQPFVPDIYASIYPDNLPSGSLLCGTSTTGVTWTGSASGALPTGNAVKTASKTGYNQIHICGNLTLNGTGTLRGNNVVVGQATLNGVVDLKQTVPGCADMKVTQYMIPGTPGRAGTPLTSSYLTR